MQMKKNKTTIFIANILFVAVCAGLFYFLWSAPPETTAHLPNDDNHAPFLHMKKKEAEKHCKKCHSPKGIAPLPADHPPKYRCLFCHKRQQGAGM
ncbi:MAG TPA: hypothetical protein ENJ30_13905 [Desulfobulbaceae bacterium]|nr:hypothetical protein [Desulfobulbaceae bacterium]